MQRLAGTIAFAALIAACSAPPPSPSDSPPSPPSDPVVLTPPDPALLAHVIRQTEAAVNIAADQRQFLARARGNRLQAIMERLSFEVPLKAAEAAHDSAPAVTESAYQASVAAHDAAFRHNRLYFNPQSNVDELLAATKQRDAAFQTALDAWMVHQQPQDGQSQ